MPKKFVTYPIILFIVIALAGVWMRYIFIHPKDSILTYGYILHGHSHLAILGWAFLGVFGLFIYLWSPNEKPIQPTASRLFSLTFWISLLMFIAFCYQGYGAYSITISSIHIFIEYAIMIWMWKQTSLAINPSESNHLINLYVRGALVALFISSIGPWSLGAIAANHLENSPIFDMAIYFYLHFQYNGWLTLILLALLFKVLQRKKISFPINRFRIAFWLYFISLFPGYFLSVLWNDFGNVVEILALTGGLLQWVAIVIICSNVIKSFAKIAAPIVTKLSVLIAILSLLTKSTLELGLITPSIALLIYDTRNIVIGYLHLTLLGFVSLLILGLLFSLELVQAKHLYTITGIFLFIIGFLGNEIILFLLGLQSWLHAASLPYAHQLLFFVSVMMLTGVFFILLTLLAKSPRTLSRSSKGKMN